MNEVHDCKKNTQQNHPPKSGEASHVVGQHDLRHDGCFGHPAAPGAGQKGTAGPMGIDDNFGWVLAV